MLPPGLDSSTIAPLVATDISPDSTNTVITTDKGSTNRVITNDKDRNSVNGTVSIAASTHDSLDGKDTEEEEEEEEEWDLQQYTEGGSVTTGVMEKENKSVDIPDRDSSSSSSSSSNSSSNSSSSSINSSSNNSSNSNSDSSSRRKDGGAVCGQTQSVCEGREEELIALKQQLSVMEQRCGEYRTEVSRLGVERDVEVLGSLALLSEARDELARRTHTRLQV
jgi:hypothetical protein